MTSPSPMMSAMLNWRLSRLKNNTLGLFSCQIDCPYWLILWSLQHQWGFSAKWVAYKIHTQGLLGPRFPWRWLSSKNNATRSNYTTILASLKCTHAHASSCPTQSVFTVQSSLLIHTHKHIYGGISPWYAPAAGLHVVATAVHAASGTQQSVAVSGVAACVWELPAPAAAAAPGGLQEIFKTLSSRETGGGGESLNVTFK